MGWEYPLEKGKATHSSVLGLSCDGSNDKESTCNVGDLGSNPGLGLEKGMATPQYSGVENSINGKA